VTAFNDNMTPSSPDTSVADARASDGDFVLTFAEREAEAVTRLYAASTCILEYGSGGSTVLAAQLGKQIFTVESDKAWADRLAARVVGLPGTVHMHHVDIGPTGDWGMPTRPKSHASFHRYPLSVWDRSDLPEPDLVLIDGRFRAACLVATILRTKRPVTVLFDDYHHRRVYHRVERLATLDTMIGRMAVFTVEPGTIPPDMLTEVVGWFSDPR